jgi:type IV pilus assembly protein PilM
MARKAVGVDIGSRYVKVAEVVREGGHTRVVACAAQEIADSSDAAKAAAVARALRTAGIRGRRVVGDVARGDAVVKRIRIPATDRETARKILEFEVQQHVPFPLEEMAWDFDMDGSDCVLLAAVRRTSLEAVRAVLAQAGLRASAVTVSSAAVATAYLQCAHDGAGESDDRAAVVLELGAGPVVVNIFRGATWLLSRSLPVSGDDLTAAFGADLGCDLECAEIVRQGQGCAALPAAAPHVAAWLQALRAEVERSLLAAAEQTTTLAVERIVATGGGWLTPGLLQAASSALGGTVEVFPSEPGPATPAFSTAIGLALQDLGLARGIDLTASAAAGARRQARRWTGSVMALAALIALIGFGTWRYWAMEQQSLALQPERAAAARREQDVQALRDRQRALEAQFADVESRLRARYTVLNALQELSAVAPSGIWLTSVSYSPGRPIMVQGRAVSAARVSDLLDALGTRAALAHMTQGEKDVDFAVTMEAQDRASPRLAGTPRNGGGG